MEQRRRPEYNLDIFADLACVKDVVKGKSTSVPAFASQACVLLATRAEYPHFPSVRHRTSVP